MRKYLVMIFCLLLSKFSLAIDEPQKVFHPINVVLLSEITALGQKITAVSLEYESNILSGSDLTQLYDVKTSLDNSQAQNRTIIKAYTNNAPSISSHANSGRFVIIELSKYDKNANAYEIITENKDPIQFREKNLSGEIVSVEKVQATKKPEFYNDRLTYLIEQKGYLKLTNGKTLDSLIITQNASQDKIKTKYIDDFVPKSIYLNSFDNKLNYRLYEPVIQKGTKYPLTIFLHGSGQVGNDNIAHILSSKGAIATLEYETGFVLAPQYNTVFDPFDSRENNQRGGIHWQTNNRINLVMEMLQTTLNQYKNIDQNRIYIVGLSRGAEGALNLLLKNPNMFAGALLMSGREAYTVEWIDGNATKENLANIKNIPIWFFHSKEDKVSPVKGSRINYHILHDQLKAPYVKYTEFSMQKAGDNGIQNNSAHNTWDAVFNSPEVINWLLSQKRKSNN